MARVSITVDDSHLHVINRIAGQLSERGLTVDQVLDGLGMITGDAARERQPALREVPGVASVDEDVTFQLPAPHSPIQ